MTKLSEEEECLLGLYEKRQAEFPPIEGSPAMKALMKAAGIERLPTLRETFEDANTMYAAVVCNPIKHPTVPMRCLRTGPGLRWRPVSASCTATANPSSRGRLKRMVFGLLPLSDA